VERVFITYNLKPGVSEEDYVAFSGRLDQIVLPSQPGVNRFDANLVLEARRDDGETEAPYHVIETVEVATWQAWLAALEREDVKAIAPDFERIADTSTVCMVRARPV
jgi:hypothetical protein